MRAQSSKISLGRGSSDRTGSPSRVSNKDLIRMMVEGHWQAPTSQKNRFDVGQQKRLNRVFNLSGVDEATRSSFGSPKTTAKTSKSSSKCRCSRSGHDCVDFRENQNMFFRVEEVDLAIKRLRDKTKKSPMAEQRLFEAIKRFAFHNKSFLNEIKRI